MHVRMFRESLEYFDFWLELSLIDVQFDTPSALLHQQRPMPMLHASLSSS